MICFPIKRDKGGKEAEAVIWSSSVLEKAVDAIKKGLPLKALSVLYGRT